MRRLTLVALGLAVVGLVVYRARSIDRRERELAIGRYANGQRPG
jgi:hypothetical protein